MRTAILVSILIGLTGCVSLPQGSPLWPYGRQPLREQKIDDLPKQGTLPTVKINPYNPSPYETTREPLSSGSAEPVTKPAAQSEAGPPPTVKRPGRLKPVEVASPASTKSATKTEDDEPITVDLRRGRK